jgi:hypothetical protein
MIKRTCMDLAERSKDTIPRTRGFTAPIVAVVVFLMILSLTLSTPVVVASAGADGSAGNIELQPQREQPGSNTTQQNTSNTTSTVIFKNQTSNGSTVTIQSVTLSEPGYIAVHSSGYATGPAPAAYSIIAVSERLSAGHHQNVTINISNVPPGNPPGLNRSRLNTTQTLAVTIHKDTNGNQQFDFVQSAGGSDVAFAVNGDVVSDSARVRVPTPPPQTASVVFRNQTFQNNTLTVAKVQLPRGGFLVAHNASYRRTDNAVTSAVGLSRYLPPGNYTNVSVRVLPSALNETQVVTIRPSLDTNDNQQYDYVTSEGFQDVAYETNSEVVVDSAVVRVPSSQQATSTSTQTQTQTRTPTFEMTTPTASATRSSTPPPQDGGDGSGSFISNLGTGGIVGILIIVVAIGGVILITRRRQ